MTSYWSSRAKHKRSLKSVLKEIQGPESKKQARPKIDKKAVEDKFRQFEEINAHGWTQVEHN